MRMKTIVAALAVGLMLVVPGTAAASGSAGDQGFCPPFDLDQSSARDPNCDDLPHFKATFLNRVWTFGGTADYYDADARVLGFTLDDIAGLPRRFRSQDDDILDQDSAALVSKRTRVYDTDGERVGAGDVAAALDGAEDLELRGKLVKPRKWVSDEDGNLVPTVRAKRIYIQDWNDDYEDDWGEEEAGYSDPGDSGDAGDCPGKRGGDWGDGTI